MKIGRVGNDLLTRDRRLALPFIPKETRALADLEPIEHCLVRHRSPANCKIDWGERGLTIVAIDFAMQHARLQGKMGQRLEMECTVRKRLVFRRDRGLLRIVWDKNSWPIGVRCV